MIQEAASSEIGEVASPHPPLFDAELERASGFVDATIADRVVASGPVLVKLGGRMVRYRPSDLKAFVEAGEQANTGVGRPV